MSVDLKCHRLSEESGIYGYGLCVMNYAGFSVMVAPIGDLFEADRVVVGKILPNTEIHRFAKKIPYQGASDKFLTPECKFSAALELAIREKFYRDCHSQGGIWVKGLPLGCELDSCLKSPFLLKSLDFSILYGQHIHGVKARVLGMELVLPLFEVDRKLRVTFTTGPFAGKSGDLFFNPGVNEGNRGIFLLDKS